MLHPVTAFGLLLDFVGVLLLGSDVVRIQRRLRSEAADRLASFQEVAEANEDMKHWLDQLAANADWREHGWDEGRAIPLAASFDPDAAKASFTDALSYVAGLSEDMHKLARLMLATTEGDERTANLSLRLSYAGLGLITLGFLLQAIAQV